MRIVVHDYAGHVGQIEVSRELARRGHEVLHLYAAGLETPRGDLTRNASDPAGFDVQPIHFGGVFQKHNYFKRQLQELGYGAPLVRAVLAFAPDAVLSANTPLFPQARLQWACRRAGLGFIFWMTDMYGLAVHEVLSRKLGLAGDMIGRFYKWLERALLRSADGVIVIAERFQEILSGWRLGRNDIVVIPVCAPFKAIGVGDKDNEWSRAQGVSQTLNVLYSGTLGHKHNPDLLVAVAEALRSRSDARVLVISEGPGADYVRARQVEKALPNLSVLPFQPFDQLSNVFASMDVLLAVLEEDAGNFSIPSKVLSHLCAGRAQVLAVSNENAVAQLMSASGAGLAVPPQDEAGFVDKVVGLLDDPAARQRMGADGRAYAERTYDVRRLGDDYVALIEKVVDQRLAMR